MDALTAIDVVILPDASSLERARQLNARMRRSVPGGFELDATHIPHITMLQRYVLTAKLQQVYEAVGGAIGRADAASLGFGATGVLHVPGAGPGVVFGVIGLEPGPGAVELQTDLVDIIDPFAQTGGTAEAFVRDPAEPEINQFTLDWVEHFVPNQIGAGYVPHITVGLATEAHLTAIEAEPFIPFTVHPIGIAVYHLGNNGAARAELRHWPLSTDT